MLLYIDHMINPSWINHIVIIRVNCDHSPPLTATLYSEGDNSSIIWTQALRISGRGSSSQDQFKLVVANIDNAWQDGHLTISDGSGIQWANIEVRPPGRYCGAMVIKCNQTGGEMTWNGVPRFDEQE